MTEDEELDYEAWMATIGQTPPDVLSGILDQVADHGREPEVHEEIKHASA